MKLIDTHAHIHFDEFKDSLDEVFGNAKNAGVDKIITVGTDDEDSRRALNFVVNNDVINKAGDIKLFATAGIHPHEASLGGDAFLSIKELCENYDFKNVLVAIGECGLDYFKNLSGEQEQKEMLIWQIKLAIDLNLPVVFHVRDAWVDFFEIIKKYSQVRGVIHSFTGGPNEVETASKYNLYFGLNGITTFTKDQKQVDAVIDIPKEKILLETDCPFLAPVPMRGKQNEPSYIKYTADFIAELKNIPKEVFYRQVLANSNKLFKLEK
jgi:TatD DNase family protein